jgi:chromosome segregation ATPase
LDNTIAKLNEYKKELSEMQGEYESASAEKKTVTTQYTTFIRQIEDDYRNHLSFAKKEFAEYEASLPKPEPPKKDFKETIEWANKVQDKAAEQERIAEEQRKADERKRKSSYYDYSR